MEGNTNLNNKAPVQNKRDSNIELLRVICMLGLVAHHIAVHGETIYFDGMGINKWISFFALSFGKIAFSCFVAMSTWYLVKSKFKASRFIKVWLEVLFYNLLMFYAAWSIPTRYNEGVGERMLIGSLLPITGNSHGYASAYLLYYLTLPVLKIVSDNINKRQNIFIIAFLALTQVASPVIANVTRYTQNTQAEFLLFILFFFISRYFQYYPFKLQSNNKAILIALICMFAAISGLWIINAYFPDNSILTFIIYAFSNDEFSIGYILSGYMLFFLFYNIRIPYNRYINMLATTTFGVLLIHDSNLFRKTLWLEIIKVPAWSDYSPVWFIFYLVFYTVAVFTVCVLIDLLRQLIEKPILNSKPCRHIAEKLDGVFEEKTGDR